MMTGKKSTNVLTVAVVAMGIVGIAAGTVDAQTVITPISAVASSEFNATSGADDNLLGPGFTELDPIETSIAGNGHWGSGHHWFTSGATPYIDFDLGGTYTVGKAHIWNWNGTDINWGVEDFTLIFSRNATFGDGDDTSQPFTGMAVGGASASYTGSHFTLTSEAGVTHIRLQVDTPTGGSFTGLSEVRFSTAPTPPATPGTLIYGK